MPDAPADPATKREIRAVGPRPGIQSLRAGYLALLKLSLCDLAGARTMSVDTAHGQRLFWYELVGEQRKRRITGSDGPLNALTAVGLLRLDDLQACVESVVADDVDGDLIETGVWRGGATILMRATLDSLGVKEKTVWAADSFQGFPLAEGEIPDRHKGELSPRDFLAVPLEEVKRNFTRFGCERGVKFVPGFFEETMPSLRGRKWSLIRLDSDSYESTLLTLQTLYPGLSMGGYLIVDDYGSLDACRRAVDDFRREHGITEPLERVDWACARWRRERESTIGLTPAVPLSDAARQTPAPGIVRPAQARIPSERELALERELLEIQNRLRQAKAELAQIRRSPLAKLATRIRRRLSGGNRGPRRSSSSAAESAVASSRRAGSARDEQA